MAYHIFGKNDSGWLRKAGYSIGGMSAARWAAVRKFLADLRSVAKMFGLVVAAFHPRTGEWVKLEDMSDMACTSAGRVWLRRCLLRVYTKEDYLVRWRQFFAQRLGFSAIPGSLAVPVIQAGVISPEAVSCYLRKAGMSQNDLAQELGVSKSLVSHMLSGRRTWTAEWQGRLEGWMERRKKQELSTCSLLLGSS